MASTGASAAAEAAPAQDRRRLPRIDFSGIGPADCGSPGWAAVREQVMQALVSFGFFEAEYAEVSPDLRDSVLRTLSQELFPLPLETKLKNSTDQPYGGYMAGNLFESLAITDAPLAHGVPAFAAALWPHDGYPAFCEAAYSYLKKLAVLEEMVRKMVLESLGVAEYFQQQSKSTWYLLRFSKYGDEAAAEEKRERKKAVPCIPHVDTSTLAIICQLNGVDGLEVETDDGKWILAKPSSPTSFFVVAGDAFRAWSNGRVFAPFHRVRVDVEDRVRYSATLFSCPGVEHVVEAPPELVDNNHPALYKPYCYGDFMRFVVSKEAATIKSRLAAFCGAEA